MIAEHTLRPQLPRAGWVRGTCAALVLLVLYIGALEPLGVLPALVAPSRDHLLRGALATAGLAVVGALAMVVAFEVLLVNRRRDLRPFGIARPQHMWSTLGIGLAAFYPLLVIGSIISKALGFGGTTTPDVHHRSSGTKLAISFLVIVVAPWLEEVSIRGLLFSSLDTRFGLLAGAGVSALFWAALHRVAFVLVPFTLVGMLLALLRWRSRSVIPGILLHGTQNSIATLAAAGVGWYMSPMPFVLLASVAGVWLWLPKDPPEAAPRAL
jgi:membrane protease YdiL (CAAX protease family)